MKSGPLCALLWRILTWYTRKRVTVKARYIPGRLNVIADKLSRLGQTIQTEWSLHPWMPPGSTTSYLSLSLSLSPRPPSLGSGCPQSVLGGAGPIRLPTSNHLGQSGGEVAGLPMQQSHSDCTGVAQHALVLGSSGHVQSNPTVSAHLARLTDSTIQPDLSQESGEPESACLAPRASAIKQQGFSEAVAE